MTSGDPILSRVEPLKPQAPLSNQEVFLQDGWLSLKDFED